MILDGAQQNERVWEKASLRCSSGGHPLSGHGRGRNTAPKDPQGWAKGSVSCRCARCHCMAEQWTWWQKGLLWKYLSVQTSGSIKSHWHHFQWPFWNKQQVVWMKSQISLVIRKGISLTRSRNRLQSSLLVQSMVRSKEKTVMSSRLNTWTVDGFFLLNRVLNTCVYYTN